ncbi:MAG TPA: hypothetical protein DD670_12835 [Planctomycetaceae bacterium]|nr:hypothetical protein [Planctomycetaceae bacterium]
MNEVANRKVTVETEVPLVAKRLEAESEFVEVVVQFGLRAVVPEGGPGHPGSSHAEPVLVQRANTTAHVQAHPINVPEIQVVLGAKQPQAVVSRPVPLDADAELPIVLAVAFRVVVDSHRNVSRADRALVAFGERHCRAAGHHLSRLGGQLVKRQQTRQE